jgi:hypothetical protein
MIGKYTNQLLTNVSALDSKTSKASSLAFFAKD